MKTERQTRILGYYNPSVWLTAAGAGIAVIGIGFAEKKQLPYALFCLLLTGIIDLFDGAVARLVKRTADEKAFGVQLDSLVDMLSFVALPLAIVITTVDTPWMWPILIFYAIAAIQRLGYFNVSTNAEMDPYRHYRGLPVTYAALILTWGWLILHTLTPALLPIGLLVLMAMTGLFFILNVPIAKPRGIAYPIFVALAVVTAWLLFTI